MRSGRWWPGPHGHEQIQPQRGGVRPDPDVAADEQNTAWRPAAAVASTARRQGDDDSRRKFRVSFQSVQQVRWDGGGGRLQRCVVVSGLRLLATRQRRVWSGGQVRALRAGAHTTSLRRLRGPRPSKETMTLQGPASGEGDVLEWGRVLGLVFLSFW